MNNSTQTVLDELTNVYAITDLVLNEWKDKGKGNLQFPDLLGMIAVKLNWDEKQMREADPLVRYYVRKHPDWYVTRGAHGGIMRTEDKQKKEQAKTAKSSIKDQMKAAIEAKVAQAVPADLTATSDSEVSDSASE